MSKLGIIGVIMVLGAALLVSFVFLGKNAQVNIAVGDYPSRTAKIIGGSPSKLAAATGGNSTAATAQNAPADQSSPQTPHLIPEERNMSAQLAKDVADEMTSKNPKGPGIQDGAYLVRMNLGSIFQGLTKQVAEDIRADKATTAAINLHIVPQTPESETQYLVAVRDVINNSFGGFPQANIMSTFQGVILTGDNTPLLELSDKLQTGFDQFKTLDVPSSWQADHKKALEYWTLTRLMTRAFATWQEDPVRTYVWLRSFSRITLETQTLTNKYSKAMEKDGVQ